MNDWVFGQALFSIRLDLYANSRQLPPRSFAANFLGRSQPGRYPLAARARYAKAVRDFIRLSSPCPPPVMPTPPQPAHPESACINAAAPNAPWPMKPCNSKWKAGLAASAWNIPTGMPYRTTLSPICGDFCVAGSWRMALLVPVPAVMTAGTIFSLPSLARGEASVLPAIPNEWLLQPRTLWKTSCQKFLYDRSSSPFQSGYATTSIMTQDCSTGSSGSLRTKSSAPSWRIAWMLRRTQRLAVSSSSIVLAPHSMRIRTFI